VPVVWLGRRPSSPPEEWQWRQPMSPADDLLKVEEVSPLSRLRDEVRALMDSPLLILYSKPEY
jgi:hypothetical protein